MVEIRRGNADNGAFRRSVTCRSIEDGRASLAGGSACSIGIARAEPGLDFIQEIQVQSVGASAEYGNLQGAVINVISKQGGHRFLADVATYWQMKHYRAGWLRADHDWKFGAQVERGGHNITSVTPTGERFIDSNSQPSERISKAPSNIGGQVITAAAFVSDALTWGGRITLNAGVRFEYNRAISQDLRAVDLQGRETSEIIPGLGTLYSWHAVSPRLGITTQLDATGRAILRASYGRFHQGVLTAELDSFHPGATPVTTTSVATGNVIRVENPRINLRLDPLMRRRTPTYCRSESTVRFAAGSRSRWRTCGRTAATRSDGRMAGQYREETRTLADGRRIPVFVLDTAVTPPAARRFLLTNQDEYAIQYNGLVVAVDKRHARGWQAFGSYTFSRAYGLQPSSGTTAAGEQTNTIGPGGTFGRDPNDLSNARGGAPNVFVDPRRAMIGIWLSLGRP